MILLILSGFSAGMFFRQRSLDHISFLEDYLLLLLDIKTEIKYRQRPLLQIFENYGENRFLKPIISKLLKHSKTADFQKAWQCAFSNLKRSYGLSSEEENIIKNFASKLGDSDTQSQVNYCDYNAELLTPYLKKATKNKAKNQRLPLLLGLSLGLIISIALI